MAKKKSVKKAKAKEPAKTKKKAKVKKSAKAKKAKAGGALLAEQHKKAKAKKKAKPKKKTQIRGLVPIGTCPRCTGAIGDRPALSRKHNVSICTPCGKDEATGGLDLPWEYVPGHQQPVPVVAAKNSPDMDGLRELAELKSQKAKKEGEAKELASQIRSLEESMIEDFVTLGIQRMTVETSEGRKTLYMKRQMWCVVLDDKDGNKIPKEDVIAYLDKVGLSELAPRGTNSSTLSGFVREHEAAKKDLPEGWGEVFGESIKTTLSVIKA